MMIYIKNYRKSLKIMKTFGTKPLRIYLKWLNLSKKKSDDKAIIKMPSNCKELSPTVVESEIWQFLERNIKSGDLGLQTVQKLLEHGIVPILFGQQRKWEKNPDIKTLKKLYQIP